MNRTGSLIVTGLLLVAAIGAVPTGGIAAVGADGSETGPTAAVEAQTNNSTGNVSAGEQLSAAIGVQEAELDGEVERRAFGIKVAKAASADAKAGIVAEELNETERDLEEIEERKQELKEARDNGSISESEYRAKMAQLVAESKNVQHMANETENASAGLPADVLEANGVNVTAIQTLKERAQNLTGPEVAAIARSIAGGEAGERAPQDVGANRTDEVGNASVAIERADTQVTAAEDAVERARLQVGENASEDAQAALDRAESRLSTASETLSEAKQAADDGEEDRALELAKDALDAAQEAANNAREALELAGESGNQQDGDRSGNDAGSDQGSDAGDDNGSQGGA